MAEREPPFGAFAPKGLLAIILNLTRGLSREGMGRRTGFALRKIGQAMLRGGPVDIESFGAKFRLMPYNNVCESRILFFPKFFDEEERQFVQDRITDGFTFLDIGANIGGYALFAASKAGPRARVLAIEPLPEIFNRLVENVRLNPFGTIKALALAVADKDEERTFFVDRANQGESSLKIVNATEVTSIRVPVRRLLTIIQDEGLDRIDGLKVDVEGAEDLILETFFEHAPVSLYPKFIVMGLAPSRWQIDLVELLKAKGYKISGETRNNFLLERSVG